MVFEEKIIINNCEENLEYMFNILSNKDLPFEKRKEISLNILLKHVDLTTNDTSISFVLFIISILRLFAANDISSFAILM